MREKIIGKKTERERESESERERENEEEKERESQISNTEWQRLIGCLKLQVSFLKRTTNHGALLRKETCKNKASYGSSSPCINIADSKFVHPLLCVRVCVCV